MAVNRERSIKWREKESIELEYVTLGNLKDSICSAIKAYSENAEIRETGDPYSDSKWYAIFVEEPETDEEMNKRIRQEEAFEDQQRRQYEFLKAKFETK